MRVGYQRLKARLEYIIAAKSGLGFVDIATRSVSPSVNWCDRSWRYQETIVFRAVEGCLFSYRSLFYAPQSNTKRVGDEGKTVLHGRKADFVLLTEQFFLFIEMPYVSITKVSPL
jgi:hypothetical protein